MSELPNPRIKDFTGQKFNNLTVLRLDESRTRYGRTYWICQCDCGNITSVRSDQLKTTKSCGCLSYPWKGKAALNRKDLTGMKFGELTVLEYFDTKWRKARWICRCSCGKLLIATGMELISGKKISCYKCGFKRASQKMSGPNNPNYHPELTEQDRQDRIDRRDRIMDSPEYRQWRWTVFKRDNYTCQVCGRKKSGTLEAHHIVRWVDDKDKRYDIDNGITLCEDCHKKVHRGEISITLEPRTYHE